MKSTRLPKRKSKVERILFTAVLLSPIFMMVHFLFRSSEGAYPSDADNIGIPVLFYWIFVFLPFALLTFKGRQGLDAAPIHLWWNAKRFGVSLFCTIISVYPIGTYLLLFLLDAILGHEIISILYTVLLLGALFVYRAGTLSRSSEHPPCAGDIFS